jgi:hypothetical protein
MAAMADFVAETTGGRTRLNTASDVITRKASAPHTTFFTPTIDSRFSHVQVFRPGSWSSSVSSHTVLPRSGSTLNW